MITTEGIQLLQQANSWDLTDWANTLYAVPYGWSRKEQEAVLALAALAHAVAEWQKQAEQDVAPSIPHFTLQDNVMNCTYRHKGREVALPEALTELVKHAP
jgi:hypothetical protein